jgi:hypothetical protein
MCCEHDHQIRLSSRPPRRRLVVDHERRSHRLTAQLVPGRNHGMLHEEVATGKTIFSHQGIGALAACDVHARRRWGGRRSGRRGGCGC